MVEILFSSSWEYKGKSFPHNETFSGWELPQVTITSTVDIVATTMVGSQVETVLYSKLS